MRLNNYIILLIVIFLVKNSQAQTDSLNSVAKNLTKEGKYIDAEKAYKNLLKIEPNNNDIRFSLGLMYSWSKRPNSKEIYIAYINNELWAEKYETAIQIIAISKLKFGNDSDIAIREAKAKYNLNKLDEAIVILENLLLKDKDNSEAKSLLLFYKLKNQKNSIGINYTIDQFSNTNSWNWASIQYTQKTAIGAIIGRINYANRYNSNGYQLEADAYPTLGKKSYAYINLGFSPSSLFPSFRTGFDYNWKMNHAFEGALGFRYLLFTNSNVVIYTGQIGKYIGNYWFSLRPYIIPGNGNTSASMLFITRRYFSNAENYLGLQLGYGSSPDDYAKRFSEISDLRLNQYNTRISFNHLFGINWNVNISIAYAYEEYFTALYRNKYTFDITINYQF